MPRISVILPAYNVGRYIGQCLDSVCNQTLKDIEIICVDDGSTDDSATIVAKYAEKDSRVQLIRQQNQGAAVARNKALDVASGEFVAFMDPDDWYPQLTTLEKMYNAAKEYNVEICGGGVERHRENEVTTEFSGLWTCYNSAKSPGIVRYEDTQQDYGYWKFIYSRSLIERNKLRFPLLLRYQDPPFFVRAMKLAGQYYYLDFPTYSYRSSYKEVDWSVDNYIRLKHLISGLTDMLSYSNSEELWKLHSLVLDRINRDMFKTYIREGAIGSKEILSLTIQLNDAVNHAKISELNSLGEKLTTVKYDGVTINPLKEAGESFLQTLKEGVIESDNAPVKPVISIIIPVYNVQCYLEECLASVLNQSFSDYEIICVDDGSEDASSLILSHYQKQDSRIRVIRQKNGGLSAARNSGLDIARGEFVYFLDSDDKLAENSLSELVDRMRKDSLDELIFAPAVFVDKSCDKRQVKKIPGIEQYYTLPVEIYGNVLPGQELFAKMVSCGHFYAMQQLRFFRRSVFEKNSLRYPVGMVHEDAYMAPRTLFYARKACVIPNKYFLRRLRAGSIMTSTDNALQRVCGMLTDIVAPLVYAPFNNAGINFSQALESFLQNRVVMLRTFLAKRDENLLSDACAVSCSKYSSYVRYYIANVPLDNPEEYLAGLRKCLNRDSRNDSRVRVSVIIPVYNAAPYIKSCIHSVLSQKLRVEVICVDDCSTDESFSICQEYARRDNRIKVVRNSVNRFAGKCRNYGAALARGEYLMFLDADDKLEEGSLKKFYKIAKDEDLDVIRGIARAFDATSGELVENTYYAQEKVVGSVTERPVKFVDEYKVLARMSPVPWMGICRAALVKDNNLRFNSLRCSNDVSFFYDLMSAANRIRFIRESIVLHRVNNKSSLMGIRGQNYMCVLKSMQIVDAHTRNLPFEVRAEIMDVQMNSVPRWLREARECGSEDAAVIADFQRELSVLDMSPLGGEIRNRRWYLDLSVILGKDAFPIPESIEELKERFLESEKMRSRNWKQRTKYHDAWEKTVAERKELTLKCQKLNEELVRVKTNAKEKLAQCARREKKLRKEISRLKNSESYKIGLLITWPMRKLFGLARK